MPSNWPSYCVWEKSQKHIFIQKRKDLCETFKEEGLAWLKKGPLAIQAFGCSSSATTKTA